jgi:hypothetical protein
LLPNIFVAWTGTNLEGYCLIHPHANNQSPVHNRPGIHNEIAYILTILYIIYTFLTHRYIISSVCVIRTLYTNPWWWSQEGSKHVGLVYSYCNIRVHFVGLSTVCSISDNVQYFSFFFYRSTALYGLGLLVSSRFHDHTHLRHTTVGRTPLEEWSARRRDLYLTTHSTHNRQTSMP